MYSRILKYPQNKSFFLFGPRGTGKSYWVRTTFPDAVYIDLLEAELYVSLLANPQRLSEHIPEDHSNWIILDEVQRIPELLNEVHRLIEKEKYKFILTGSSARKLKRKSVNLLAGRALTLSLFPLTVLELSNDFNLERSLQFGHLPSVSHESNPEAYLKSYVQTYLQEEIQQEGLTRNLAAFTRFLESASFSQGSILNVSEVARECSVGRKVVEQYFQILEDLLLADFVPPFTKKAKRRLRQNRKFYFFDVGVYRTLRPKGPLDQPELIEGAALETLFYQELKALNDYLDLGFDLYYWQTAGGIEVDFVAYGEKGIFAFEIKRQAKINSKSLKGLKLFKKDYPLAKTFLIYGGDRTINKEGIQILPFNQALICLKDLLK